MKSTSRIGVLAILLAAAPASLAAQRLPPSVRSTTELPALVPGSAPPGTAQDTVRRVSGLRPLRVAKWSLLAGAAASGIYGFVQNNRADDRFEQLERLCQDQAERCDLRTPDGAYADAEFEALYQEVGRLDSRSHTALLLSQAGIATSVVLFLLDLDNSNGPGDIPWVPSGLRVAPGGRTEIGLHIRY
jgi:hypothetical protein